MPSRGTLGYDMMSKDTQSPKYRDEQISSLNVQQKRLGVDVPVHSRREAYILMERLERSNYL